MTADESGWLAAMLREMSALSNRMERIETMLTKVSRVWLCEHCYWGWPLDLPFCGVCGAARASAAAEREVIIRDRPRVPA